MKTATSTTTKPTTYNKPVLYRVCDKSGKLLGYSAEPETLYEYGNLGLPKTNYQVTCDERTGIWSCTCPSRKPCKHIEAACEMNEIRLGVRKVEEIVAEEVAPEGDMSVEESFMVGQLRHYEEDLHYWDIKALRKSIDANGLSVKSKSKEPLIVALVAHRRETLTIVSEMSTNDKVVSNDALDELPELPVVEEEVLSVEPLEEEFTEDKADVWTQEEIARIREAALPKYEKAPLNGRGQPVVVRPYASEIATRLAACGFMR